MGKYNEQNLKDSTFSVCFLVIAVLFLELERKQSGNYPEKAKSFQDKKKHWGWRKNQFCDKASSSVYFGIESVPNVSSNVL